MCSFLCNATQSKFPYDELLNICCGFPDKVDSKHMKSPLHKSDPWEEGLGYAMATILLRLPGHAPMLAFNHIVDVPLIVPHAKLTQQQVRRLYIHCKPCLCIATLHHCSMPLCKTHPGMATWDGTQLQDALYCSQVFLLQWSSLTTSQLWCITLPGSCRCMQACSYPRCKM